MMVKTLTRQGNSSALIIDRTLMDLMGIDQETPLKITVARRRMVIEPVTEPERKARVRAASRKLLKANTPLYRRLAK
jgi:antitoxin component of MazEF toxin-antitoxin module